MSLRNEHTKLQDIELARAALCRAWLESQGMSADDWRIEWPDGGSMYITALRDGKSVREFKSTPEATYERDPYITTGAPKWTEVTDLALTSEQRAAIAGAASVIARFANTYEYYGGIHVKETLATLSTIGGAR